MKPIVLYHANCPDGFCAAWVAHKVFPDAEFIPVQYSEPVPFDVTGRDVLILDFSYKRDVMRQIICAANTVVVLDHHKTAQAELAGISDGLPSLPIQPAIIFDMNKSGGRLTWEYFYPDEEAPYLVAYTEDRDLWRFDLPFSREVSAALRSYPFDFDKWDEFSIKEFFVADLAKEGIAILRYQQTLVDTAVRNATEIELDGHKILAVNSTVMFSEVAGELSKGRPFGAAWFIRGDGKKQWSLRSTDEGIDCSEIAKAHGGGGHRNASGFEE